MAYTAEKPTLAGTSDQLPWERSIEHAFLTPCSVPPAHPMACPG